IASAANLTSFGGFCFSSEQPENDELNDCSSCEFAPSATQYPKATLACGTDPTMNIRRTERREMKLLLDLIDSKTVNGTGCLSENIAISYGALYNRIATMPSGTSEGQTGETGIGGSAIGTAVSSIDAFSIMDVLKAITPSNNPSTAERYKVWA